MSERWPMFANLRALLSRMRNSFRDTSLDRDLEVEMASHLQFAIEDNLKSGMSQEEAQRQAQLSFGGPQQSKEAHRDSRGLPFLHSVLQDLRFAFRLFRKAPSFSVSAILTLALGIGATTAVFSVVYGVLLRPLPYPAADRLVRLSEEHPGAVSPLRAPMLSNLTYYAWSASPRTIGQFAGYRSSAYTITRDGDSSRLEGADITPSLFAMLGETPALGRFLRDDDAKTGSASVAVLSDRGWRERFNADPSIIG